MPLEAEKPPEISGNHPTYPQGGSFAQLLGWHLDVGTRPTATPTRPGKRWTSREFADKLGINDRSVRNWRAGRNPPTDLPSIERELFGENPALDHWRIDLRAAFDGHRPTTPPGTPIPRPPPHFLGREQDIATILPILLNAPAAILVQGGPGIGKTSLTKAIARHPETITRFGDPTRWFVELDTANSAAALQDAITRAIGLDPARGFPATLQHLRQHPGLLVLDNLETPWDPKSERPATETTLADLADIPGLALLASFRGNDHVGGPPWTLTHQVTQLPPPHDTTLFRRIANADFHDDPHLPRFMEALAGIPLAIELVAARAHGHTALAALWTQWTRIGAALATHPDFDAARLTSLPHSIELSLASPRMTGPARRLFRLLGQLPAGLAPQDRDALLGDHAFDAEATLRRTALAIERNNRLDLLPPIRGHATRHHPPDAADSLAWPSHYLGLAQARGESIGSKEGEGAVARLAPEFANIESAIRAALATGERRKAMAALPGFARFTSIAAVPSLALHDLAAACRADHDALGEADCIMSLGDIALRRSDHAAARTSYDQALPLYRQVGNLPGEANCIMRLGNIALRRSDHAAARTSYEQALPLYRQAGSVLGEANGITSLGDIALARSDHAAARTSYEQALPLYRQVGDLLGEANCIMRLGDIALARSDHAAARTSYEQALPLYRQVGDLLGEANCIKSLGDIALQRSDHAAARASYDQALPLYRHVGDVQGEANCIKSLGDIALARSDHAAARTSYEQALPLYRQAGSVLGEANCIRRLGDIALARSDHAAARTSYDQALPLYRHVGDVQGEANCIKSLGDIALAGSDHAAARASYEQALPLYRHVGDVQGEANCIKSLGDIALAGSDHAAARAGYEQALPLYRQVGDVQGERTCAEKLKALDGGCP